MNTEITDDIVYSAGWLFYDSECPWCCASAQRFGRVLARRRFGLRPLQSPGAAQQLGLESRDLLHESHLLLTNGHTLGGADAVVELARHIWWAWPLWLISRFPGAQPAMRATYRRIAANRHCVGGACTIHKRRNWRDCLPLLLFPALAVSVRDVLAPWVFMWLMAFAIYGGFKWLTYRDTPSRTLVLPTRTRILYLLFWPGMSLKDFAETPVTKKQSRRIPSWLGSAAKTLAGGGLWIPRRLLDHSPGRWGFRVRSSALPYQLLAPSGTDGGQPRFRLLAACLRLGRSDAFAPASSSDRFGTASNASMSSNHKRIS